MSYAKYSFIIAMTILSYFSQIYRIDYFGALVLSFTSFIFLSIYNSSIISMIYPLKKIYLINIVYDAAWLIIHWDGYLALQRDFDFMFGFLQVFSYFLSLVCFVGKFYILFCLIKAKRSESSIEIL